MAKRTRNTSASAYPVEAEALNQQQDRMRKAAAAAAAALKGAGAGHSASPGVIPPTVPQQQPLASGPAQVSFQLHRPNAAKVSLAGDFNGWSSTATPLQRNSEGTWQIAFALAPGRHQYKFIVDGEWITDPAAAESAANEFGSVNSVVTVN